MLCLEGFLGNLFTCFRAAVALLFSQVRHIKRICLFNIYLLSSACHFRGHRSTVTLSSLHHHYTKFWNINQMSFGAPFRVVLRSRLTLIRLTLIRNPWSSGVNVSHIHYRYLCLHLLFLMLQPSSQMTFAAFRNAPLPNYIHYVLGTASAVCFTPAYYPRPAARLVSCYALFRWMAASKPTS